MKKENLVSLLQKLSLNRFIDKSYWVIDNNQLTITANNINENLYYTILIDNFIHTNCRFILNHDKGVVSKVKNLMEDKNLEILYKNENLLISDGRYKVYLSTERLISIPTNPSFSFDNTTIDLNHESFSLFLKSIGSVNAEFLSFNTTNSQCTVVVGDDRKTKHSIRFSLQKGGNENVSLKYFNVRKIKSIFQNNYDCLNGKMYLYSNGYVVFKFAGNYFESEYYVKVDYLY